MEKIYLEKASYFIDNNEVIYWFDKDTESKEYENLTPITEEEVIKRREFQNEISQLLYELRIYKDTLLSENIIYKDISFQADYKSLENLIASQISNIQNITWYSASNTPIDLTQEDIKEIITIISKRNSEIINNKQIKCEELIECNSYNELEEWKNKYKEELPFLQNSNNF